MYACSTTRYTGFQAVMTEEMSEKFSGVVFILPDSYIDPVNKEYGGDKYINGTIIPWPPRFQYNYRRTRYVDQNRNNDCQMYDRPRDPTPMPQAGNARYDRQGPMQGDGRNYTPQQNYGQTGQDGGVMVHQQVGSSILLWREEILGKGKEEIMGRQVEEIPCQWGVEIILQLGRDNYQGERREPVPSYSQGECIPCQLSGRDYPPGGRDSYQGERRDPVPSYQRDYAPPEHRDFRGDYRDAGPPGSVDYRQGMGSSFRQDYNWAQ